MELRSLAGHPEVPPRDAALSITFGQTPPGMAADYLFGEQLFPVAHADVAAKITSVEDLLDHPIIEVLDHRRNWLQVLNRDFLPDHIQTAYADTTFAALALARAQAGIALARAPASNDLVESFGLKRCLPGFAIGGVEAYHLLYPTGHKLTAGAAAFRGWMIDQAQNQ